MLAIMLLTKMVSSRPLPTPPQKKEPLSPDVVDLKSTVRRHAGMYTSQYGGTERVGVVRLDPTMGHRQGWLDPAEVEFPWP